MKYHIHIPKLLEFALNVVCDDVTLHGKQCLKTPIPYPLYLRCILTYNDKYERYGYSTYGFYRDVRLNVDVNAQIGRLYPNALDHVLLNDDDVDSELLNQVTQYTYVDDAAAAIQRFASRCLAADKYERIVNAMSRVLYDCNGQKAIIDLYLSYGAKLNITHYLCFQSACHIGARDVVKLCINIGHRIYESTVTDSLRSGDNDTIKLVFSAYRGSIDNIVPVSVYGVISQSVDLHNATVQSMELCMSLNIIRRKKHYKFENIPSFSVLQWILDHDVMEHDAILIDIARNAARYSGHYFDMLRYLIEQRNFTVPRDVLLSTVGNQVTDLGVWDYLICHGADLNVMDAFGRNVLERSTLLIRYWIDSGIVLEPNRALTLIQCILQRMTAPVLEMIIDKYSMNVNAVEYGETALYEACHKNNFEVAEMLLRHGADVNKGMFSSPYDSTSDMRIKQLLIEYGYKPREYILIHDILYTDVVVSVL